VITTYGTLKTELAATSHRGDMAARIPFFIQRSESMIATLARTEHNSDAYTFLEADRVSGGVYELPTNCLEVITVFDGNAALERRSRNELAAFAVEAGVHSYALRGSAGAQVIEFRGAPPTDYATLSVLYYYRFPTMASDSDTNTLLWNQPEIYLHAALHWLYLDVHDLEMSAEHRQLFQIEVERLNTAHKKAMRSGSVAALARTRHGSDY